MHNVISGGEHSSPPGKVWKASDLAPVLEALQGLRYGSVEIIIQDFQLIQIDRKEKIRGFKS
jgi:hypothetical protein